LYQFPLKLENCARWFLINRMIPFRDFECRYFVSR